MDIPILQLTVVFLSKNANSIAKDAVNPSLPPLKIVHVHGAVQEGGRVREGTAFEFPG